MLIFLLFSLFFLPFSHGKQWKMMLIYGEPTGKSPFNTTEISWDQCYSSCYNEKNCEISYYYSSECRLYTFGNYSIKQLDITSGKIVGIKRHLPDDQCPDLTNRNYSSMDTWQGPKNVYANLNKISKNETHWSITYSNFACDNRTNLFRRDNYWVCVGARAFDGCGDYEQAGKLCKETGISLTAPYNLDEWQYFNASKGTYDGYTTALWSDGKGKVFADETLNGNVVGYGANWKNSTCPYIDYGAFLSTNGCKTTIQLTTTGEMCFHGAACLMKSLKIN